MKLLRHLQLILAILFGMSFAMSCDAPIEAPGSQKSASCDEDDEAVDEEKEEQKEDEEKEDTKLLLSAEDPNYNDDIKTPIGNTCARANCHVTGSRFPPLDTEVNLIKYAPDAIVRMDAGTMPPGGAVNPALLATFKKWIDKINNPPAGDDDDDEEEEEEEEEKTTGDDDDDDDQPEEEEVSSKKINYKSHIKGFLKDNCLSCHDEDGSAEPDLSTFALARRAAKKIINELNTDSMPPSGDKISSEDKAEFRKWIQSDYPESKSSKDSDSDDECSE